MKQIYEEMLRHEYRREREHDRLSWWAGNNHGGYQKRHLIERWEHSPTEVWLVDKTQQDADELQSQVEVGIWIYEDNRFHWRSSDHFDHTYTLVNE